MIKENLLKILSGILAVALVLSFVFFTAGASRFEPENAFGKAPKLIPDVIYGVHGENTLSNSENMGENSESKNPNNTDIPDDKPQQTPEGIPETPKDNNAQNQNPNNDNITETPNGDVADDGDDNMGNEEAPEGSPTVITDLENKIVTSAEIYDDTFSFFAYIENEAPEYSLRVTLANKNTSNAGKELSVSDDYYETKLTLGGNYFTIYLLENGKEISSAQYVITYQKEKADAGNGDVGEGISITTNLDGYNEVMKNRTFTFTVAARTYSGDVVYSNHIEVTLNGEIVDSPTGATTFEYVLHFSEKTTQNVTVLAWDDEGNSSYREYEVNFEKVEEGDAIGVATVVIDATTAGLGIIGSAEVEIFQGDTAATTLLNAADLMGLYIGYSGNTVSGFYVRSVGGFSGIPEIPESLMEYLIRDGISFSSPPSGNELSDADFTAASGWMYSIDGTLYPGKGLSAYNLSDGDTLYLRYTVSMGKDFGSGGGIGMLAGYCGVWMDGGYYELDHEYEETDRGNGYTEYTCSICEKVYREEISEDEEEECEHEYEADYESYPGYVIYYCPKCGHSYEEESGES